MNLEQAKQITQNLIQKTHHFVISTIDKNGYPDICALIKLKNNGWEEFYFSTNEESEKIKNIEKNNKGCIYYYDPFEYTGITLKGTFEKKETKTSHFDFSEEIFPEGLKTRNYVLLTFHVEEIKCYHLLEKIKWKVKE